MNQLEHYMAPHGCGAVVKLLENQTEYQSLILIRDESSLGMNSEGLSLNVH